MKVATETAEPVKKSFTRVPESLLNRTFAGSRNRLE